MRSTCRCTCNTCIIGDYYVIRSTLYPKTPYYAGRAGTNLVFVAAWADRQLGAERFYRADRAARAFDRLPSDIRDKSKLVLVRSRHRFCGDSYCTGRGRRVR